MNFVLRISVNTPIWKQKKMQDEKEADGKMDFSITDINHFVSERGEFIAKTEFVGTIFFGGVFDLIVLFLRRLIKDAARGAS